MWDLSNAGSPPTAGDLPKETRAARFTGAGTCVAVAGARSTMRISQGVDAAPMGPDLHDLGAVERVVLAPDCAHAATLDKDDRLRIWDTRTARYVVPRRQDDDQFGFFQNATFSPDGTWFATQANDGSVRVWSASTGAPRTAPLGYVEFIDHVSFSADGRFVIAVGHDAAAMVWDASTGEQLADVAKPPFLLHNSAGVVAWSADAGRVFVGAEAFIKDLSTITLIGRVQDLGPDRRDVAELAVLAQWMAGRKLDGSGTLVNLTTAELAALATGILKR